MVPPSSCGLGVYFAHLTHCNGKRSLMNGIKTAPIFLLLLCLLFGGFLSCEPSKKHAGGEGAAEDQAEGQKEPSPDELIDADGMGLTPSAPQPELAKKYEEISDSMLTITDQIRRDWLNGQMTQAQYLKQKLCYFYSKSCLAEKYRPENAEHTTEMCGTSFLPTLEREIQESGDEALIKEVQAFWDAIVQGAAVGQNPKAAKATNTAKATSISGLAGNPDTTKIVMKNGSVCFNISSWEPDLESFRFLTEMKAFDVDQKLFEIFYETGDANKADKVKDALVRGRVVSVLRDIVGADPKAYDSDDPQCNPDGAYRLFIVRSKMIDDTVAWMRSKRFSDQSYIGFRAEKIDACFTTSFIRDDPARCASTDQRSVDGVVAHEYFHAVESAFLSDISRDDCSECLANWAIPRVFPLSENETSALTWHLYQPKLPLGDDVGGKKYGSYLFFLFLKDLAGDGPIRKYLSTIKDKNFTEALEAVSREAGYESFAKAWLAFAESGLNLQEEVAGVHRFRRLHETYRDIFLPAAAGLIPLPDHFSGPFGKEGNWNFTKISIPLQDLEPRSIRYIPLVSWCRFFNASSHYFKVDASNWEGGLGLFAINVDARDPTRYHVVDHAQLTDNKVWEWTVLEAEKEPDAIILVATNGNHDRKLSGSIAVESKPFDGAVHARATISGDVIGGDPSGETEERQRYRGVLEGDMDLKARAARTTTVSSAANPDGLPFLGLPYAADIFPLDGNGNLMEGLRNSYTASTEPIGLSWDFLNVEARRWIVCCRGSGIGRTCRGTNYSLPDCKTSPPQEREELVNCKESRQIDSIGSKNLPGDDFFWGLTIAPFSDEDDVGLFGLTQEEIGSLERVRRGIVDPQDPLRIDVTEVVSHVGSEQDCNFPTAAGSSGEPLHLRLRLPTVPLGTRYHHGASLFQGTRDGGGEMAILSKEGSPWLPIRWEWNIQLPQPMEGRKGGEIFTDDCPPLFLPRVLRKNGVQVTPLLIDTFPSDNKQYGCDDLRFVN